MLDQVIQCPDCENPAVKINGSEYQCINPRCWKTFEYDPVYVYDWDAGTDSDYTADPFVAGFSHVGGADPGHSRTSAKHCHSNTYRCVVCGRFYSRKHESPMVCMGCGVEICPKCYAVDPWCLMCYIKNFSYTTGSYSASSVSAPGYRSSGWVYIFLVAAAVLLIPVIIIFSVGMLALNAAIWIGMFLLALLVVWPASALVIIPLIFILWKYVGL